MLMNNSEFFENMRLSDILPYLQNAEPDFHPMSRLSWFPPPDKTFFEKSGRRPFFENARLASNTVGNPGTVMDRNNRAGELYPDPNSDDTNRQLEDFHKATGGDQWQVKDIGDIDENFRRAFAKYFTG
jgi:hypothetical protein